MTRRTVCPRQNVRPAGFTLIELLVVVVIVVVIAAIALPVFSAIQGKGGETKTVANMRQMGIGLLAYANDNSYKLPNRVQPVDGAEEADKWPRLLHQYVEDLRIYGSPIPDKGGKSYRVARADLYLNNSTNYTTYIYNGGNDVQEEGSNTEFPRLNNLSNGADTILLGVPMPRANNFYMDFREKNNNGVLNKTAFPGGTPYVFCDGSSRMLKVVANVPNAARPPDSGTYTDWLWLFNKEAVGTIQ